MGVVGNWDVATNRPRRGTGPAIPPGAHPGGHSAGGNPRQRPLLVGVVAVCVTMLTMSGCGSSQRHDTTPTSSSATTVVAPPVTGTAVPGTTIPNNVNLRKNVTMSSCGAVTGGWAAGGIAVSAGGKTTTYTITIYFVTSPGDTVQASGVTQVTADPGRTADWQVVAHFSVKSGIQCVLRGVS